MRLISTTIICLVFTCLANAQAIIFKYTYGQNEGYNEGNSVVQLPDSGFIMAGTCSGTVAGATDILLVRTNKYGQKQWLKTIGGLNVDVAYDIKAAADGNYFICGYTNSYGHGGYDVYVVKININGDTLFTKTFGGADWDFGRSIQPTSDGGFVIAGETYSYGRGFNDYYVLKIDNAGAMLWEKVYGTDTADVACRAIEAYNGDILVAGHSGGYSTDGTNDVVVMRLAANGDSIRSVKYATVNNEVAYDITEVPADSGYYVCGTSFPPNGGANNFMYFKSNKGDTITNTYIINNGYSTTLRSILSLPGGKALVGGYTYPPGDNLSIGLIQNFIGDWFQWQSSLNVPFKGEKVMQVIPTSDGGFCAVGKIDEVWPGLSSAALVKIGPNGEESPNEPLSVKNIVSTNFSFYPNPTQGNLNLQFEKPVKTLQLAAYNSAGQLIFIRNYKQVSTVAEDFSAFDNGLYLVQIIADGKTASQRLIITK